MDLEQRVAALERHLREVRAHHVVLLAEIEALMFCTIAALRCAPIGAAMQQLTQQMENLRAMTLACPTSDDVEEVRSRKAQQVYELVAAAVRQPGLPVEHAA